MKAYFYILMAIIAWGVEYVLVKMAVSVLSPLTTGIVIFLLGGLFLYIHLALSRQFCLERIKKNVRPLLLVGGIGATINGLLLFGLRLTTAANASLLGKTDVLFSLLLAALFFKEKIRRSSFAFITIMLIGVAMLSVTERLHMGQIGDGLIIASAFLLALNAFFIKQAVPRTGALLLGMVNCLINAGVFAVFQLIVFGIPRGVAVDARTVAALIGAGLCVYCFFVGYYRGLKTLPVWEVRLLMLGIPVVTALTAFGFLDEELTLRQILGMVLILGGAAGILLSGRVMPRYEQR